MAKRIKWIENKDENYRGNWSQFAFRLNNSDYIFEFGSYMTYKTFKSAVMDIAQVFGATEAEILPATEMTMQEFYDSPMHLILRSYYSMEQDKRVHLFYKEIPVGDGERRQYRYYDVSEVFKNEVA